MSWFVFFYFGRSLFSSSSSPEATVEKTIYMRMTSQKNTFTHRMLGYDLDWARILNGPSLGIFRVEDFPYQAMLLSPVQFLLFASFLLENFNFRQITWKSRKYQKHHLFSVILSLKSSCFFRWKPLHPPLEAHFLHIFCWVVTYVDLHHLPSVSFFHGLCGRVHHSPP